MKPTKDELLMNDFDYGAKITKEAIKKGKAAVKFHQKYPNQKGVLSYKIFKLRRRHD